jgi:hypothetical protein
MTALADDGIWKHCNICKAPIPFGAEYFVCSVSTCNRKRTGLLLCSLACFEAHLPTARHRDAWAEQKRAPTQAEWRAALAAEAADAEPTPAAPGAHAREATSGAEPPMRRVVEPRAAAAAAPSEDAEALEVLVVVSKVKKYVRDWSGMNTSDGAMAILSDHLRELCREATRQAGLDSRRTVLDRDFMKVLAERREALRKGGF